MPPGSSLDLLRAAVPALSVGILTADLLHLGDELGMLEQAGVSVLHIDVMDGCFTPAMTVGPPFVKALNSSLLKDVHLMVTEPLGKVADYAAAGADIITVHVESCVHVHRVLQVTGRLQNANDPARGIVRGLALNPGTPLEAVEPLLDEVDLVVLLAVNPGWGGQAFLPSTFRRIAQLKRRLDAVGCRVLLGVDGGITRQNVAAVRAAGADLIVTGSAIFDGKAAAANAAFMLAEVARPAPDGV